MALKDDKMQVYVTLPKDLVRVIDKDAEKEMRTRSKQLAKIIIDHYGNKKEYLKDRE